GGCLAVYGVFAVVFHWFVEPTVKSQPVAAYEAPARNVQPSNTALVVRSEPASRVTSKARTSPTITTTPATPEMTGSVRSQTSRVERTRPSVGAPEFKQPAREEPRMRSERPRMWVVTKPGTSAVATTSKSTGRSEAPMWSVSKGAASAPATDAASSVPTPTARTESPAPAASEPASAAFAAAEPTDPAAAEAKKTPKKAHKTVRRERPPRQIWNRWKFFASGPFGRPSF